jgi:hypothetical protein
MQLLAWNITKNGMATLGTLLLRLDEMTGRPEHLLKTNQPSAHEAST